MSEVGGSDGLVKEIERGAPKTILLHEEVWHGIEPGVGPEMLVHKGYETYRKMGKKGGLEVELRQPVRWRVDMTDNNGSGSFSEGVHMAFDEKLGGVSVVKIIDAKYARLAFKEAKVLGGLNHPNVLKAREFLVGQQIRLKGDREKKGETPKRLVLVMERCPCNLDDWSKNDENVKRWDDVKQVMGGVEAGANFLHTEGIYHGDLKLANVLMGSDGQPKIIDLGGSIYLGERISKALHTPSYSSPKARESYRRRDGKEKASTEEELKATVEDDNHSMGVMLFRILTMKYGVTARSGLSLADLRPSLGANFSTDDLREANEMLERLLQKDVYKNKRQGLQSIVSSL